MVALYGGCIAAGHDARTNETTWTRAAEIVLRELEVRVGTEKLETGSQKKTRRSKARDTMSSRAPASALPKKKATSKKMFIFEAWLSDDIQERSEHKTSTDAAKAAWEFCDFHGLEMPSADWVTETRYGPQECYNVMVPAGDWEPDTAFVKFMSKHASRKGEVRLTDGDKFVAITKEE